MDRESYREEITVNGKIVKLFDIGKIEAAGHAQIDRLPFSIRILLENMLRKLDGRIVTENHVLSTARWQPTYDSAVEIPFHPARVLMQDFTGVPAVVDLASMREAVVKLGKDAGTVNPLVPTELIVDHSVQVDYYGCRDAAALNVEKEYERNGERYAVLKWAQKSFDNFKAVPPRSGICHQVNLEHLGRVVMTHDENGETVAYPDTLVGLDSHTPMINGLGVLGWGVGGIEAEAVMLGQPYYMVIPEVIGVKLTGELQPGVTATDLVLTVTELMRLHNVVGKFTEFTGAGVKALSIPDRATISNMTPEYGASLTLFPVDEQTIAYLRRTGRGERADLVEAYCRANRLFYTGSETPEFTTLLELDLSTVVPCVAGPSRPQDRIPVRDMRHAFTNGGDGVSTAESIPVVLNGVPTSLSNGSVVIAAITSCTNTSNPSVLMGAALLAKNAVELGLKVPPYVKTSFAPGSAVVPRYLDEACLTPYLEALGFHIVGYGCTTCIGNSGPLHPTIDEAITRHNLNVASVLSGNRNFEARIHQKTRSNYLASPMLVVAYALAGKVDIDLTKDPVGLDPNGRPVYLEQLWPSDEEIQELVREYVKPAFFDEEYSRLYDGDEHWQALEGGDALRFQWNPESTYIKNPPYFDGFTPDFTPPSDFKDARALAVVGDTVTTDHISPAGAIPSEYPAGKYLIGEGVKPEDFNSYGSRRGNHEVMIRGTFGNVRLKNKLVDGKEGSFTRKLPEGQESYIFEAAEAYGKEGTPLIVLGGREYGTGSSRDWAAKGTRLLGVRAVIACSYERIHRSNLVCMGVLPLELPAGQDAQSLGLDGTETFSVSGINDMRPGKEILVQATKQDGSTLEIACKARLDTEVEVEYYRHGGILPYVLRKMIAQ